MTEVMKTVIVPVKDLSAAKAVYGALLGVEPIMDESYYVQYEAAGLDIGLDPHGHAKGMTGPVAYWHVADLDATLRRLVAAGATEQQGAQDVGGGKLVATVTDPDGNAIGLIQEP